MKKLTYLLALLVIALVSSCNKEINNDFDNVSLKDAYVLNDNSRPISYTGTIPVILGVDKPRGGNITCQDVEQAFLTTFTKCGEKVNYGDFDGDGDYEFDRIFENVNVTVTNGTFIEFTLSNNSESCYMVGAVIVKGGNSANVYYYPNGTINDSGLAAPFTSSGAPANLSNLTFCLIDCKQPPSLVVAFKGIMTVGYSITGGGSWSIGYKAFVDGSTYPIYLYGDINRQVGILEVGNYDSDPLLEVKVSSTNGSYFTDTYLFVGTVENFTGYYLGYPYHIVPGESSSTVTFYDISY